MRMLNEPNIYTVRIMKKLTNGNLNFIWKNYMNSKVLLQFNINIWEFLCKNIAIKMSYFPHHYTI